jgi:hypothetical protein
MSTTFTEVAEGQDGIGWEEFLHGKVSKMFQKIQDTHCILLGTNVNGGDWMKQFTERLINISHAQWLYQNFTLHHYAKGYLRQRTENDISREVKLLVEMQPSEIPPESRYLLELPQRLQMSSSSVHNAY